MQTIIYVLYAILVLLQALDIYTTLEFIQRRKAVEGNPVMKFFMDKLGKEVGLILPKVLLVLGMGAYVVYITPVFPILVLMATAVLCVIYVFVYKNNKKFL